MDPVDKENTSGVLMIPFEISGKSNLFYLVVKRFFDIICGLLGTLLVIPIAIVIKTICLCQKDFAPIFFLQDRIGKDGKKIRILKFRSMVPDAEKVLDELMEKDPKIKEEYTVNKKLENDPRITKLGSFIRKTSIDEFPQFINVLIGNMSLVGPRPYLFREKEDMGDAYDAVIKCKPGITGLWQVSGRSDVSFKYRLKLDKLYNIEKSLRLDLKILVKTFSVVIFHKGAK